MADHFDFGVTCAFTEIMRIKTVHISSFRTRRYALKHWEQLTRRHAGLLGGRGLNLARVDLGAEKGVWIRVRAGPLPNLGAAEALCRELRSRNLYCAPQTQ